MALSGKAKIFSSQGRTKYVTIPSAIAADSAFPFASTKDVQIVLVPETALVIVPSGEQVVIDGRADGWLYIRLGHGE